MEENTNQSTANVAPTKKEGRRKRSFFGWVWRILWITVVALFLLSIVEVIAFKFINPPLTPLMIQRFGQQLFQSDRKVHFERDYVSIDEISPNLVNAVVASEDGNFMRHHGFDVRMLKQSYRENKQGRRVRGGSTISMQTAKNAFLPHKRSMARKALEAYFTQLIEWTWGKKRIMECCCSKRPCRGKDRISEQAPPWSWDAFLSACHERNWCRTRVSQASQRRSQAAQG